MPFWRSSKGVEVDVEYFIDLDERLAPYHVDFIDLDRLTAEPGDGAEDVRPDAPVGPPR